MRQVWIKLSRQHHRAEDLRIETDSHPFELRPEKGMVESRVMRDQQAPREPLRQVGRDVAKGWRVVQRARLRDHGRRQLATPGGPDQGCPSVDAIAVDRDNSD